MKTFVAGEKLPVTLSREELAQVVGLSLSRFDAYARERSHPAIKELEPRVGRPRFCGRTAQRWLDQAHAADEPALRFFRRHR